VVVSGLFSPYGHPGRILDAVTDGQIKMAYDARILAEYREVLNRAKFRLAPAKIANFLATLRSQNLIAATSRLGTGPDPDDLMFIEVALETPQKTIVTGNLKDYPRNIRHGVRILTPAQAMEEL
jgi:putative PIN family toxin of toxin-antitoxin system